MQTYTISTGNTGLGLISSAMLYIMVAMIVVFAILLVLKLTRVSKINIRALVSVAVIAVAMLPGWAVIHSTTGNYTFEIGNGQVSMNVPFIGNQTYNSSDMQYAFVDNLQSGNITLATRNSGTSIGSLNEGHFTTNTGATAYVVSDNNTNLVILLKSGTYIILGTNSTNQMASYFSNNVFPVS